MGVSPNVRHVTAGHYKVINGVWHKRCVGPSHEEPTYLPANEKYFYKGSDGRNFRPKCRLCENWIRIGADPGYEIGWVPRDKVLSFYREAVARCGMTELARRAGVSRAHISNVLDGRTSNVQKRILRKVLLELISMRRKGEYSINSHARWRNERRLIDPENSCSECGGRLENQTEGCRRCFDRHHKINTRNNYSDEKREEIRAKDRERRRQEREAKRLSQAA